MCNISIHINPHRERESHAHPPAGLSSLRWKSQEYKKSFYITKHTQKKSLIEISPILWFHRRASSFFFKKVRWWWCWREDSTSIGQELYCVCLRVRDWNKRRKTAERINCWICRTRGSAGNYVFFKKKKEDRPTRQTMKPSLCVLCWCFIINPSVLSIFAQIDRLDNVTDEGTKQLIVFFYFFLFHTERRHFAIAAGLTHYILYIHLCWIVLFWRYYTDKKK